MNPAVPPEPVASSAQEPPQARETPGPETVATDPVSTPAPGDTAPPASEAPSPTAFDAAQTSFNEAEYLRFVEYLQHRTGLSFGLSKRYYVEKRLHARMGDRPELDFDAWFATLHADPEGAAWQDVINTMTVNETYFYREPHQFECMSRHLLDERLRDRQVDAPPGPLRVWSMPSSTGEEPYSIAIWLLEHWPGLAEHDVEILASDIDTRVLEAAERGEFSARSVARLPRPVLDRHFAPLDEGSWRIDRELVASVQFSRHNLCDPQDLPQALDLIFCRNLLIYFDDSTQLRVLSTLFDALTPGGFLCLGHAEILPRHGPPFVTRRFPQGVVYQRPLAPPTAAPPP
ncbi:CheR family methyltransferase [Ideonella livida]|uniref:protein-glutamate O-methyltransferase n=1 Tax=Ideonella livida TaxID=2707176 RepID=A0A7C9TIU1_9BURK|nr:protein-glutamate O-methyltransferase CheR [Ideonella livida]NDY90483.1 hypothetical protein [Ideonella livida]